MKKLIAIIALVFGFMGVAMAQYEPADTIRSNMGFVEKKPMLPRTLDNKEIDFSIDRELTTGWLVFKTQERLTLEGIELVKNYVAFYYAKVTLDRTDKYNAYAPCLTNNSKGCVMRFPRVN